MEYRRFAVPLCKEDYVKCFKTYKNISSEWNSMFNWIQENLLLNLPDKKKFSILSVGCGTGDFDFQLIQILKSKFKTLEYVAIEPNKAFCQEFDAMIALHSFDNVRFELHSVPFEKFSADKHFDLIHMTHCLYYIPDRERAILNALDLILDDGCVLIFNQTQTGINQIQRKFLKSVKGSADEMFSSREIQAILDNHHVPYHFDVVDSYLEVSDCFRFNSESGEEILSFILESDVRKLLPAIKQDIIEYIKELSICRQGRFFIFHPVAIFSVFR